MSRQTTILLGVGILAAVGLALSITGAVREAKPVSAMCLLRRTVMAPLSAMRRRNRHGDAGQRARVPLAAFARRARRDRGAARAVACRGLTTATATLPSFPQ